jgi:hypothetical protein
MLANAPFNESHGYGELLHEENNCRDHVPCLLQMQAHVSDGCAWGLGT